MPPKTVNPTIDKNLEAIEQWGKDVFLFGEEALGMKASEPIEELRGKVIKYKDGFGREQTTILFDNEGRLVYHDLAFYTRDMFKNQDAAFIRYKGTRFTWQQTVVLEAYNRAIATFDKDSYDLQKRWITVCSGHGVGKTATLSVIILHFLICFFGSQTGATANTESQLKDNLLKEISVWRMRIKNDWVRENIEMLDDFMRMVGEKDWFVRFRVSRPENPEALAGLHAKYVLNVADEASGIDNKTFETMKGALTGENYIVLYTSNPTRTEGEFYDSHKDGSLYTRLRFSSIDSPIVKAGYIEKMAEDYGRDSDEFKIRVLGEFASVAEMDDKGWMPLFANMTFLFEPERGQVINGALMGVDPAGQGKDRSIVHIRDSVYLKEVLNEATSSPPDLARKVEAIRDAYNCKSGDIAVDAFGIGAQVVANIGTKMNESVLAVLADKPREGTETIFNSFKAELAWKFRAWVSTGGIIVTNNQKEWLREMGKIKYKRDRQGRIQLMPKVDFKKEYGFSPDRFDAACYTFVKDEPSRPAILTKQEMSMADNAAFLRAATEEKRTDDGYSSM